MVIMKHLTVIAFITCLAACNDRKGAQAPIVFSGICDGSAAVRTGRDQLLVAYDETNNIYAYSSDGGAVLQSYPLNNLLKLSDTDEIDIEAAVLHDEGIWWVGSHGLDSDADSAPNRELLFKTDIPTASGDKLTLLSGPFNLSTVITESIQQTTNSGEFQKLAPKKGGTNIEGLSVTRSGDLLVALRSPLSRGVDGDALVLQLAHDTLKFVASYQLDLNDRGIRDLVLSDEGYVLIAGDVASGGVFSIFNWNLSGEISKLLDLPAGFNAEALVDMGSQWLVLSDDGKTERLADTSCDKLLKDNSSRYSESIHFRGLVFSPG